VKGLVSATIAATLLGSGGALAHAAAVSKPSAQISVLPQQFQHPCKYTKHESAPGTGGAGFTVAQRFAVSSSASKKLVAVDGSSLILTTGKAGLTREIIATD